MAARAFEDLGAHVEEVKVGIEYDQRELSDVWCRMILPVNIEAIEGLKAQGIDLLGEHPDDLPPQYLRWVQEGYRLSSARRRPATSRFARTCSTPCRRCLTAMTC